MTPRRILTTALWFGLVAGLAEAAFLAVKKFYLGNLIKLGNDFLWMTPVAAGALLLVAALPFVVLSIWRPGSRRITAAAIGVMAFLAAFNVFLLPSAVALYAKAILAAGAAMQASRLIVARLPQFDRLVSRTLPWLGAAVVVLAVGLSGARSYGYRNSVGALPSPPSSPNVVLIVLDTVRARSLSLYGYDRPTTPTLEDWASRSIVFERAIAPSPWTFPSHATMFTGRWPHEMSANWQTPLDGRFPTLAEALRDRGYLTAGFAANTFYCTEEFGMARGFLHYEDYPASRSQFLVSSAIGRELFSFSLNTDFAHRVRELIGYKEIPGRRSAEEINGAFLRWLDKQDESRPFFAFLNYLDAHQPFLPPAPFAGKFGGAAPPRDPTHTWDRPWTPADVAAERDAYDEAIAYLDHQLGRLADELQNRGELDNTVVIVTSDHGEHFGEHGFMRHGNTLYMDVLHVPLLIRLPRPGTVARVIQPVSLRDLPATVLAAVNVSCEGCIPGQSLSRFWTLAAGPGVTGENSPAFAEVSRGVRIPDRYPNAKGSLRSVTVGNLHYIVNSNGIEELYDLASDPLEANNIVNVPEWAARRDELKERLRSWGAGTPGGR